MHKNRKDRTNTLVAEPICQMCSYYSKFIDHIMKISALLGSCLSQLPLTHVVLHLEEKIIATATDKRQEPTSGKRASAHTYKIRVAACAC